MTRRSHVLLAALTAFPLATVLAQSDAEATAVLQHLRVPVHTLREPGAAHDEIWTAGPNWKASFHAGLELRLSNPEGSSPRLRWHTTAATVGGRELTLQKAVARAVGDGRCELDLGALIEAYDVRDTGLEQTFVLRERLADDLVVTGALSGDFAAPVREAAHQALVLRDAAGNVVHYGAATVVDANGDALAIATSSDGARVALHVPGAWLATAAYPVTIDPLLSPVTVRATSSQPNLGLSIDRDDRHGSRNLGIAVERQFAVGDRDLYFVLCDGNFANPVVVWSRATAVDHVHADVAYVAHADRWACVYQDDVGGVQSCYFHLHAGADTTFSTTATMLTTQAGGRQRRPVVGGNRGSFAQGDLALILREWEPASTTGNTSATEIWASRLNVATGQEQAPFRVAGSSTLDAEAPAVSRDCSDGSWMIAFQTWSNLVPTRWGIAAKRVPQSGNPASGLLLADRRTLQEHLLAPKVDGADGRYLIGYQSVSSVTHPGKIAGERGEQVYTLRFDWPDGIGSPTNVATSRYLLGGFDRDYQLDSLAHDTNTRSHWLATARSTTSGTTRTYLLGYDGATRFAHDLAAAGAHPSAAAFDDDSNRFALTYAQGVGGGDQRVDGRSWVYPTQAAPSIHGTACPGAGLMSWLNAWKIGSEFPTVRLLNSPANGFAMLLTSFDDANVSLTPFGLPGCTLLVDVSQGTYIGAVAFATNAVGAASLQVPLPTGLPDFDLHFQWAVANSAAAGGFVTTQGLSVEVR